jgi:hypothetical protein
LEDGPVPLDWDAAAALSADADTLEMEPMSGVGFGDLPAIALKATAYRKWQKDLTRWTKANHPVTLLRCKPLKLTSTPEESEGEFRSRMALALHEQRDLAVEKLRRKYASRFQTLKNRLIDRGTGHRPGGGAGQGPPGGHRYFLRDGDSGRFSGS